MCQTLHCERNGCENPVSKKRTDGFCSDKCKETHDLLKFVALQESYKELGAFANDAARFCRFSACGKSLEDKAKGVKFCSLKCYDKFRAKNKKKKNCALQECQTTFVPYRKSMEYCSRACYLKAVNVPDKICLNKGCGKKLNTRNQKKFCSKKCNYEYKFGHSEKFDVCQKPGCCNKLTDKRSSRKYCSHACYDAVRSERKNAIGIIKLVKRKTWKYPRRFIKTDSGWKSLSVFTWEKYNGPVPYQHFIGFKDGDSFNDEDINNLKLVSCITNLLEKREKKEDIQERDCANSDLSYEHF